MSCSGACMCWCSKYGSLEHHFSPFLLTHCDGFDIDPTQSESCDLRFIFCLLGSSFKLSPGVLGSMCFRDACSVAASAPIKGDTNGVLRHDKMQMNMKFKNGGACVRYY